MLLDQFQGSGVHKLTLFEGAQVMSQLFAQMPLPVRLPEFVGDQMRHLAHLDFYWRLVAAQRIWNDFNSLPTAARVGKLPACRINA
jgi:hypothetical protein